MWWALRIMPVSASLFWSYVDSIHFKRYENNNHLKAQYPPGKKVFRQEVNELNNSSISDSATLTWPQCCLPWFVLKKEKKIITLIDWKARCDLYLWDPTKYPVNSQTDSHWLGNVTTLLSHCLKASIVTAFVCRVHPWSHPGIHSEETRTDIVLHPRQDALLMKSLCPADRGPHCFTWKNRLPTSPLVSRLVCPVAVLKISPRSLCLWENLSTSELHLQPWSFLNAQLSVRKQLSSLLTLLLSSETMTLKPDLKP